MGKDVRGEYKTRSEARQTADEMLRRAQELISRSEWKGAIDSLVDGILTAGFNPELSGTLAFAYDRSDNPTLAVAALWGSALDTWVPEGPGPRLAESGGKCRHDGTAVLVYQNHIDRAIAYFKRVGEDGDTGTWLLFEYLRRRFELKWVAPFLKVHLEKARKDSYLSLMTRLADRKAVTLPSVVRLGRVDRVIVPAMYCDVRPLPDDFFASIYWSTVKGGYDLTHAVLALQWLRDLKCITFEGRWKSLHQHQADRLLGYLRNAVAIDDLFVESVAMLYYLGEGCQVHRGWIEHIARAQQLDGGWSRTGGSRMTNDHTTFLALWALLELSRPQTDWTKMILPLSD